MARSISRTTRESRTEEEPPSRRRQPRGADHQIGGEDAPEEKPRRRATKVDEDDPKGRVSSRKANDGWGGVEKVKAATSLYADDFKLVDGDDEVIIKFLEDAPYDTFNQHWVQRDGKKSFTCLEDDCPLCDVGDSPSAQVCFNVVSLEDPDNPVVKRWRVGVTVANLIRDLAKKGSKTSPISRDDVYYAVKRTKTAKKYNTTVVPVKVRDLEEDYEVTPLTEEEVDLFAKDCYDASSTETQSFDDLEEIADEISGN